MDAVSRRSAVMGALGVAGLAVVGCTGQQQNASQAPTQPAPAGTTPPASTATPTPTETVDTTPRWPLTGKPLDDPADAQRIVVAVKVPDNQNEHPQAGINKADIVYVQMDGYPAAVGQSGTRLVPVFHSRYADDVAAVRSIRPVDIPMLSPMTAIIGNTGAAGWVLKYVQHFDKYLVAMKNYMATKGTGAYSIDGSRVRTWQGNTYYDRAVVCHPKVLAGLTKKFQDGPQQMYFPWAATDEEVSTEVQGKSAKTVRVPWKTGNTWEMLYTYDPASKRYLRSEPWGKHILADGTRVSTDNVMVIRAKQVFGHINVHNKIEVGGYGHQEPIHDIINTKGTFYYAHGGKYVKGTWTKGGVAEVFQFTLDDGSPLKMAPGQTFVELPNSKAKITIA
jgi:hypothetical protein